MHDKLAERRVQVFRERVLVVLDLFDTMAHSVEQIRDVVPCGQEDITKTIESYRRAQIILRSSSLDEASFHMICKALETSASSVLELMQMIADERTKADQVSHGP